MEFLSTVTVAGPALGIALNGCSSTPAEQQVWVLESFAGDPVPVESRRGVASQFSLADGTVTGDGGVNNFTGTYKISGKDISFGPLAARECQDLQKPCNRKRGSSGLWNPRPTWRSETRR